MKNKYLQTYTDYIKENTPGMVNYPTMVGELFDEETKERLQKTDEVDDDFVSDEEVEDYLMYGDEDDIGNEKEPTPKLDDEIPLIEKKSYKEKIQSLQKKRGR